MTELFAWLTGPPPFMRCPSNSATYQTKSGFLISNFLIENICIHENIRNLNPPTWFTIRRTTKNQKKNLNYRSYTSRSNTNILKGMLLNLSPNPPTQITLICFLFHFQEQKRRKKKTEYKVDLSLCLLIASQATTQQKNTHSKWHAWLVKALPSQ